MTQNTSPNLYHICHLLSDTQYINGTTVGRQLNITRTAVWKMIEKLKAYGITIESIKGKGYRLAQPLTLLDTAAIQPRLNDPRLTVTVVEKTGSTNDAIKVLPSHATHIPVCLAEYQTQGKGRLARSWHAPFATNLLLSMRYTWPDDISQLSGLSLVVGLAIRQTLDLLTSEDQPTHVKWPNDCWVNHQKIGGTLIEINAESHGNSQVIIGIGLNINMQNTQAIPIEQPWTSLQQITGQYHDRNPVCVSLLNNLTDYIDRFRAQGLNAFIEEWQQHDALLNQNITIKVANARIQGVARGINLQGHLLLEPPNCKPRAISSGDATLLK